MRQRVFEFVGALREAGLTPSVGESLDAAAALATAGVERRVLRACLAATLVKDQAGRPVFDELFERYFPLVGRPLAKKKRPRPSAGRGGAGGGGEEDGGCGGVRGENLSGGRTAKAEPALRSPRACRRNEPARDSGARGPVPRRDRALLERPFHDLDRREVDELADLVDELARRFRRGVARRLRHARRGRLDLRRTMRRALSRGGVPVELLHRRPRPGKSDLLALVDLSYSAATAAQFLLSLLVPASGLFRHVRLFAYVDVPVRISFEQGYVIPHETLDLYARSDFGRVLREVSRHHMTGIGRNTVLLVLGDARNNRRPPRADLLAALRARGRALIWLNPEEPERWNTGDSVLAAYARHADAVLPAWNPRTLAAALRHLARMCL